MRSLNIVLLGVVFSACTVPAWAGDGIVIYNDYSQSRYIEVRAGQSDDCFENAREGFVTLDAQQRSDAIPYGPSVNVSIVCARYSLGENQWSEWFIGTCPGDGVCEIDMR